MFSAAFDQCLDAGQKNTGDSLVAWLVRRGCAAHEQQKKLLFSLIRDSEAIYISI